MPRHRQRPGLRRATRPCRRGAGHHVCTASCRVLSRRGAIAVTCQQPIPGALALGHPRGEGVKRNLSQLSTLRQSQLLDVVFPCPGAPDSGAAAGRHIAGMYFGVAAAAGSPIERGRRPAAVLDPGAASPVSPRMAGRHRDGSSRAT